MKSILFTLALVSVLLSQAMAGEGHDHGDEAPAGAAGPALPRFAAVSEAFELVGIVNRKQLAIYLDRFEDNSPVPDARLELEVGGKKLPVAVHAPGEYEATLPEELKPGVTPVTVMLQVKGETDLLAGEIDIHAQEEPAEAAAGNWLPYAGGTVAVLAALAAVVAVMRRKGHRAHGGAA